MKKLFFIAVSFILSACNGGGSSSDVSGNIGIDPNISIRIDIDENGRYFANNTYIIFVDTVGSNENVQQIKFYEDDKCIGRVDSKEHNFNYKPEEPGIKQLKAIAFTSENTKAESILSISVDAIDVQIDKNAYELNEPVIMAIDSQLVSQNSSVVYHVQRGDHKYPEIAAVNIESPVEFMPDNHGEYQIHAIVNDSNHPEPIFTTVRKLIVQDNKSGIYTKDNKVYLVEYSNNSLPDTSKIGLFGFDPKNNLFNETIFYIADINNTSESGRGVSYSSMFNSSHDKPQTADVPYSLTFGAGKTSTLTIDNQTLGEITKSQPSLLLNDLVGLHQSVFGVDLHISADASIKMISQTCNAEGVMRHVGNYYFSDQMKVSNCSTFKLPDGIYDGRLFTYKHGEKDWIVAMIGKGKNINIFTYMPVQKKPQPAI